MTQTFSSFHAPSTNGPLTKPAHRFPTDPDFLCLPVDFLDADVTIRECALVERGERCYRRVWPGEAVVTSCDCYGEGCNGADRPRWTGRLAATAAVLVNLFPP